MEASQFNKLLQVYTEQFLLFVTSGIDIHKQAFEIARDKIEDTLAEKKARVAKEQSTLKSYASSIPEERSLPNLDKVNEEYETAKIRYMSLQSKPQPSLDTGYSIMMRIGILFFVFAALFLVGWFTIA
jgi:hypothetical protein